MTSSSKNVYLGENSVQKHPKFSEKFNNLIKYLLTGEGFGEYEKEENLFRFFLRKPIPFKTICKILQLTSKKYISSPTVLETKDENLNRVIKYTLKQIELNKVFGSNRRMQYYYDLIQCFIKGRLKNKKLLIIGPKFITELFLSWTYGFKWKNIYAIDLISNHPKIKLMDADNLKFKNLKFDAISMANVFGYNKDPHKCIEGISKSLNKDGVLVFNSSQFKNPLEKTPLSATLSDDDINNLLKKNFFNVISREIVKENESAISVVWVARKLS